MAMLCLCFQCLTASLARQVPAANTRQFLLQPDGLDAEVSLDAEVFEIHVWERGRNTCSSMHVA